MREMIAGRSREAGKPLSELSGEDLGAFYVALLEGRCQVLNGDQEGALRSVEIEYVRRRLGL